jgi:undecaprenyl-diphosphatase
MIWINQLLFGLVQGFTEVFPVSSSAHIAVGRALWEKFTGQSTLAFSALVFLHMGTFFAILVLYRRDVLSLWRSAVHTLIHWPIAWRSGATRDFPLGQQTPFYILVCLSVTGALGALLKEVAEHVFVHPLWTAVFLTVNGVCLLTATWYIHKHATLSLDIAHLELRHYLFIGLLQGLAVIPGISRFGLTLIAGLLCGLAWYQALRLSLLLSLPTVLAAALWEFYHDPTGLTQATLLPILLGIVMAGLASWIAIRMIRREDLHAQQALGLFGSYCVVAGPFYLLYFWQLGV